MSRPPTPQACAIPFRRTSEGTLEFCLITSIGKKRWIFPKGLVDPGQTPAETATRETLEEAGLSGHLHTEPVTCYDYRKWGLVLRVHVFLLEVRLVLADWEEAGQRRRCWAPPEDVRRRLGRPELLPVFEVALEHLT